MDATKVLITENTKVETQISTCFTTNQCEGSKTDTVQWFGGDVEDTSSELTATEKTKKNQTLQCIAVVFPKLLQEITSCVLKSTGLTVPTGILGSHSGIYGPASTYGAYGMKNPKNGPEKPMDEAKEQAIIDAKLKKACEKSKIADAAHKTMTCVNTTLNSAMAKFQDFCAARNSCIEGMAKAGCNIKDKQHGDNTIDNATNTCLIPIAMPASLDKMAASITQCTGLNLTEIALEYYNMQDDFDASDKWGQESSDTRYKSIIKNLGGTEIGPWGGLDLEDFACASFHGVDVPADIKEEIIKHILV